MSESLSSGVETPSQVDHPSHYTYGKIEAIDVIDDWDLDFELGNVIKYVCRFGRKNGLEDLKKAVWYLNREIDRWDQKQ